MNFELIALLGYARRWWWLLVLLPVLAGIIANELISRQHPLYAASATLLISPGQSNGNSTDMSSIQSGQRLAATYQQLVATEPVLGPVAERLGPPFTVGGLQGAVSAGTVSDTQLLRITVSDTDPEVAARIANWVAAEFQDFISRQELVSTDYSQAGLDTLIQSTEQQIADTQARIQGLEAVGERSTSQEAELNGQLTRRMQLEDSLERLIVQQQNLGVSVSSLQTQAQVYVPATVPGGPYAPRVLFYTLLSAFFGGLIAVGVIGFIEYLDNTVKPSLDFLAMFGAPMLSVVPTVPRLKSGSDQAYILTHPTSNAAEALRLLRTNVEFAAASRELSTLMVTSAVPGEGKSTITANLGLAMAQSGFSVVIVDADLRRPSQHRIFGLNNQSGLTTLLTHPLKEWQQVASDIVPGLRVISSGPLPPNPADLLSTERLRSLIDDIQDRVDVVLLDTPPVLAVSDALVVSSFTDAVLLVSLAGQTRIGMLQRAFNAFPETVRRVGMVLNQQERGGDTSYYYYGYYGPDTAPGSATGRSPLLGKLRPNRAPLRSPAQGVPSTDSKS